MKIAKQRLKEIIKEELENSQNEGFFDKLKAMVGIGHKFWDTHIPQLERDYRMALASNSGWETGNSEQVQKAIDDVREAYLDWTKKAAKGVDTRDWWLTMSGKQDRKYEAIKQKYDRVQAEMFDSLINASRNERQRAEAQRARDAFLAQIEREEERRKEGEEIRRRKQSEKDPTKERPNRGLGLAYGDARSEKERYGESKITKSALKSLIAEELTKAEKARKKKLEKELDDLKHK